MRIGAGPRSGRWWVGRALIPVALVALVLVQTGAVRRSTCETYDESIYLKIAVRIFRHADFAGMAGPMSPPLPLLLGYWLPGLTPGPEMREPGWEAAVPGLIARARLLAAITFGAPLVLLIYGWIARRRGLPAGALAGGLVATSPTVLAAAGLATTDACFALFGVLALLAVPAYRARGTTNAFLALGGAIGLALASKQSAVVLFAVAGVELWLRRPRPSRALRGGWWLATRGLGLVAVAFLVAWALCGFAVARYGAKGTSCAPPGWLAPALDRAFAPEVTAEIINHLGMPLAVDTLVGQMAHARTGHGGYLLGQTSFHGWWSFFPVALATKSTPAELVLMALGLLLACRPATWRDPSRRAWLLGAGFMLAAGMASSVNIGQRYMILIYPLAILLGVDALAEWAGRAAPRSRPRRLVLAACLGLGLGQATSAVGIAPHYLAYFNSLCGGPAAGHRILLDSSLDWGQDLPSLRRALEARDYHRVALNYFGTARPEAYGLRAVWWKAPAPGLADCDWLAISATALHEVYDAPTGLYERFKDLPSARAGHTIFLYDLADPRVRAAWEAACGHHLAAGIARSGVVEPGPPRSDGQEGTLRR